MKARGTKGWGVQEGQPDGGGSPQRVVGGDEHGGFELLTDKAARVLHMKMWGVWSVPLAKEFCASILDTAKGLGTKGWAIVADSTHFGVQSPEVARLRQETIATVRNYGCEKIAAVVSTAVYSMQFKRITEESHVGSAVFQDEKSALDWIRSSGRRTR